MEIIAPFIKKFKLSQLLLIIFIVTGVFIILNDGILEQLGLLSIKNGYHEWIGLSFVVSSAALIIIIIEKMYKFIYSKYYSKSRLAKKNLKNLTDEEQQILLRNFYDLDAKKFMMTSYIDVRTADSTLLTLRGLAIRSSSVSNGHEFPYTLYPYVYKILENNLKNGNIQVNTSDYLWNCK